MFAGSLQRSRSEPSDLPWWKQKITTFFSSKSAKSADFLAVQQGMRPRSGSYPQLKARLPAMPDRNYDKVNGLEHKEIELTNIGGKNAHWGGSKKQEVQYPPVFQIGSDKEETKLCDIEFRSLQSIEELNAATLQELEELSSPTSKSKKTLLSANSVNGCLHEKEYSVATGVIHDHKEKTIGEGKDRLADTKRSKSADPEAQFSAITNDLPAAKQGRSTKSASPELLRLHPATTCSKELFSPMSEVSEASAGVKSVGTGSSSSGSYLVVDSGKWRTLQSPDLSPIGTGASGASSDEWVMYPNPASMKSVHIKADELKELGVLRTSEEEEEGVVEIVAGLLDLLGQVLVKLPLRDLPMIHGTVLKWERLVIMAHHTAAPVRAAVIRVSSLLQYMGYY